MFEYENRLRHIIYDIMSPVERKLKEVSQQTIGQKLDIERYKKYLVENMEWVRELGDANAVEDKLMKKVGKVETTFELAHNSLNTAFTEMKYEFTHMK